MNKTLKKVLIFLLIFVVVAAIIIAVELYLSNREQNGTDITPTASVSVTQTSESPSEQPSPSETEQSMYTREVTDKGVLYTVNVPGGFVTYQLTVDDTVFSLSDEESNMKFVSLKDADEFIQIGFIEGKNASELAPTVLNSYLKYNEFEQSGENYIDGTDISGETVIASDGKIQMEAWLVDTPDGVVTIVISYTLSQMAAEKAELESVLSSLAFPK